MFECGEVDELAWLLINLAWVWSHGIFSLQYDSSQQEIHIWNNDILNFISKLRKFQGSAAVRQPRVSLREIKLLQFLEISWKFKIDLSISIPIFKTKFQSTQTGLNLRRNRGWRAAAEPRKIQQNYK